MYKRKEKTSSHQEEAIFNMSQTRVYLLISKEFLCINEKNDCQSNRKGGNGNEETVHKKGVTSGTYKYKIMLNSYEKCNLKLFNLLNWQRS